MWKDASWLKLPEEEILEKEIYEGDMTGRAAALPEGSTDWCKIDQILSPVSNQ
jgi:hypothetical protein